MNVCLLGTHSPRFKEGFTDIISVLMFSLKKSIATKNFQTEIWKPTHSVKTKIWSFTWENEYGCHPLKKLGYDTKKNSKAVLSHRFNLFLNCLTSLTSPDMSKKRLILPFFLWDSEGSFIFVLQWIFLLFSHKCSIVMCSSHGICEILNWLLPLLS